METKKKLPRCPKCRGRVDYIHETYEMIYEYNLSEDGVNFDREGHQVDAELSGKVFAHCGSCAHYWRLKGISQIRELEEFRYEQQ